jgi:hypothetical protein
LPFFARSFWTGLLDCIGNNVVSRIADDVCISRLGLRWGNFSLLGPGPCVQMASRCYTLAFSGPLCSLCVAVVCSFPEWACSLGAAVVCPLLRRFCSLCVAVVCSFPEWVCRLGVVVVCSQASLQIGCRRRLLRGESADWVSPSSALFPSGPAAWVPPSSARFLADLWLMCRRRLPMKRPVCADVGLAFWLV